MKLNTVVVLDFGSQYTQLIARRIREQKVFSVILPYNARLEEVLSQYPKAIVFSGSPANVYQKKAPLPDPRILNTRLPILGICYGLQLIGHLLKGKVKRSEHREYGHAELFVDSKDGLFHRLPRRITCWMSHGDQLVALPKGFEALAHTTHSPYAAIRDPKRQIYGVQFHPEVVHTPLGNRILANFLFRISNVKADWTSRSFIEESIEKIRRQVGKEKIVLGLSGGVDSSVAAVLIHRAIGKQLTCIFVDNGLLRLEEAKRVKKVFEDHFKMRICSVIAEKEFLKALQGVTDPEIKRKTIGRLFIEVFERETRKLGKVPFLAQGTLYPDVIESVSVFGGPTSTIKSHHNVGGLPSKMKFRLVEPLRMLFKDEVREVGRALGLSSEIVDRQPFPGPGLAVRVIGEVTKERLDLLRRADWIVIDEVKKAQLYKKLWQAFAVLLPIQSVGVMGDERTYENVVAVRAVTSQDGMTADWAKLPEDLLGRISNRIINEVRGINRVCYDISSKPPATIEWE
ncbi:MAG: glutamine-hydrolyzing GMP synthase [Candidatus Omnitrophica bacterium]|nr:glutamine-hydrolyzing GMP synthase [Candidatus Omnitrophota bacterium]